MQNLAAVARIKNGKLLFQADFIRLFAQHAHAQRMKSRHIKQFTLLAR